MRSSLLAASIVHALLLCAAGVAQDAAAKSGVETCEDAATRTIIELRGSDAAQEVDFVAAKRSVTVKSAQQTSIRGEGRYRGTTGRARAFSYNCAYDADTGTASGVVLKELGGATPAAREKAWEPDMSRLSPEACETAVAAALKRQYRSVGVINFAPDTRRLSPAPEVRTRLEGSGQLERAPGLNSVRFSYRCDIEPRSGKLVAVETGE